MDDNSIYVTSATLPDFSPIVVVRYKEQEFELSVTEARTRTEAILKAASIAESEANIFLLLNPPNKGFKLNDPTENSLKILRYLREKRSPLPNDVNAIFGFNTQKPLVSIKWYGEELTLETDVARHHAQLLIECAEAAETDGFLYHFLRYQIGSEVEEAQILIEQFADFRRRNRLEDLFLKK